MMPQIFSVTVSSTEDLETSRNNPPMVSYDSYRLTYPRMLYWSMQSETDEIWDAKSRHWHLPRFRRRFASAKDYVIGGFKIHSFITNHNNDAKKNVPVTVFQIDCGQDSGGFTLMHSGDSNYIASQYDVTSYIDVFIPRYAPNELAENNVIGKVCKPEYVLLSHILELSHTDPDASRWTLQQGLSRAVLLDCEKSYMPFWGERLVWKDGALK